MESSEHLDLSKKDSSEVLPPLIKYISATEVAGFDCVEELKMMGNSYQQTRCHSFSPSATRFIRMKLPKLALVYVCGNPHQERQLNTLSF
ncbi:hypothetical protein CsSME_00001838 [Camellia sinensis var. sinensis]